MRLLASTFIILYSISAYSFDLNNLQNIFGWLDDAEPKVNSSKEHCCDPTTEEIEEMNQCAIDLCGNSSVVDSAYVSDSDYEQFYRDEKIVQDYVEFKPKLKKYLNITRIKTRDSLTQIKDKSIGNSSTYFNLDQYTDKQISSVLSDDLSSSLMVEIKKDKNGNKKVKVRAFPSKIQLDDEIKQKYVDFKVKEIKSNFSTGIYSGYLELEEGIQFVSEALEKLLVEVDKRIVALGTSDETAKQLLEDSKSKYLVIQEEVKKVQSLTKENVTGFFYSVQGIDYSLPSDLKLKYYNTSYDEFECNSVKCKEYLSKRLSNIISQKNLDEIIKETKDDKKSDTLIDTCEYFWHNEELKKAKANKKQEFIDSMPAILARVKKNFSSKFSKESEETLTKYFKDLKYAIADDKIPGRSDFNYLEYVKENVLKIVEPSSEEDSDETSDTDLTGILKDYEEVKKHFMMGKPHFEHELTSCDEANVMASDHFSPEEYDPDSYIHISSFSCNHYTTGKKVLAHELGHAISGQFLHNKTSESSSKKYLNHRSCITQSYKDSTFSGESMFEDFTHSGDTKYSEEDMADFVAAQIYGNPNESLLSCALIAKDSNDIDYNRKKLSVLNSNPIDTHSSPFLRTLKEAILKSKVLTPSCRNIMDKYKDRINFNKCEF